MKKSMYTAAIALTIILGYACSEQIAGRDQESRNALEEWKTISDQAERHSGALMEMKMIIQRAETNHDILVDMTRMVHDVPFHTEVLLKVAESASKAQNEEIDFLLLAELAVIKLSESKKVTDLAEYASRLEPGADLSSYNKRYQALKDTAEASSVEEAIKMVENMIKRIREQASEL